MSRLKSMQGLGSDCIFRTTHFKANCDLEFNSPQVMSVVLIAEKILIF